MAVITLLNAQLAYGHVALLDHTDFSLESGERVGLIGRNGAGKSSLGDSHPEDIVRDALRSAMQHSQRRLLQRATQRCPPLEKTSSDTGKRTEGVL